MKGLAKVKKIGLGSGSKDAPGSFLKQWYLSWSLRRHLCKKCGIKQARLSLVFPRGINQEVSEDNVTNSLINVKHYGGRITEIILELKKMCSGIRRKDKDNIIQIIPLELRCQHKMELMLIIIAHRI